MINTIQKTASDVSYGASAVTVVSGLTVNEWGVVCGLLLATLTFLVNWYYRHKTYELAKREQKDG